MGLFLCKPHVEGPNGHITSPDVIVDRVFVNGSVVPVNYLTHDAWQQSENETTATAGYAVLALGGGELLLPVVVLSSGIIVVARCAWRLKNMDLHIGEVTLNEKRLADIGLPNDEINAVGGIDGMLQRGLLVIKTISESNSASEAQLIDNELGRSLRHKVVFEPSSQDQWGDARPTPRYAEGPTTRDVPHYI